MGPLCSPLCVALASRQAHFPCPVEPVTRHLSMLIKLFEDRSVTWRLDKPRSTSRRKGLVCRMVLPEPTDSGTELSLYLWVFGFNDSEPIRL